MQIFLFIALFIAVVAVLFAVQNTDPVTVSFAFWETEGSLALVLLIALAAGALISFFVSLPSNLRTRWTIRQQRKKMNELESNLSSLRLESEDAQKKIDELTHPVTPPPVLTPSSTLKAEIAAAEPEKMESSVPDSE